MWYNNKLTYIKNKMIRLPVTIYITTILGGMGFAFYGLSFILLMFVVYWLLSLLDIATGVLISHRTNSIRSEDFGAGVVKRALKSLIVWTLVVIGAHLNYLNLDSGCNNICFIINIIPIFFQAMFLIEEIISLIENTEKLSDKNNKTLELLRKVFGMSLEKGTLLVEDTAEDFLTTSGITISVKTNASK